MDLRALEPRVVAVTLAVAAAGGLLAGAVIGAAGDRRDSPKRTEASTQRPAIPPFVVFSPTATPKRDHPSPDLGNLTGVKEKGDEVVVRFDRVTLDGDAKTGYTINNQADRVRERTLADDVKVTGSEKLTGQPAPKQVPLSTLLEYLRSSAEDQPLLVWLYYDDDGRVVDIREQNLP